MEILDIPLKWLLLPFYKSKGSRVTIGVLKSIKNLIAKNKSHKRRHAAAWIGHAAACLETCLFYLYTPCRGMKESCRGMLFSDF